MGNGLMVLMATISRLLGIKTVDLRCSWWEMTKFFITDGRQSQVVAGLRKRRKQLAMTKQRNMFDKHITNNILLYCKVG